MSRTRGIVRDLRRLTFALEPITLRDHGFGAPSASWRSDRRGAHGIEVAVDARIVDDLKRPVQVCLYRIAQEALANTVKHAGATHVSVRAHRRRDGSVEFAIADDGAGTSPEQLDREVTTRASTRCASAPPASAPRCASRRRPEAARPCASSSRARPMR